jgi:hypothetical protein
VSLCMLHTNINSLHLSRFWNVYEENLGLTFHSSYIACKRPQSLIGLMLDERNGRMGCLCEGLHVNSTVMEV